MNKVKRSYRLPQKTINQIETLVNLSSKENIEFAEKISAASIIEEAVDAYFIQKMDANAGDPYLLKMENIVSDELKKFFAPFVDNANNTLFNVYKNQEQLNLIMARLQFPESEAEKRKIIFEENPFEELIEQKIYMKISGGKNKNENEN